MINEKLLIPWLYGTRRVELGWALAVLRAEAYHPDYVHCLGAWLTYKNGVIGIGSRRREHGGQPSGPGYVGDGESFHQPQSYSDGWVGPSAIDAVRYNPGGVHATVSWANVPARESQESKIFGIHANVGWPGDPFPKGEPWHLQSRFVYGFASWQNAGRPAPKSEHLIPTPPPPPPEDEDDMRIYLAYAETRRPDGTKPLWRGNGLDSNEFDRATQIGMEGRPIDSVRNGPYWHPFTETKLTAWSQVPTVTANQIILDLGKPR